MERPMSASFPFTTPEPPRILRLFSGDDELPAETLRQNDPTYRTLDPVRLPEEWPLRKVLQRLQSAWPHSRKDPTWKQYWALVNHWERFWLPGPCVSEVTSAELLEFFESVEEWGTQRSWEKNLVLLKALFKSACRQSHANPEGMPRSVPAPLMLDDLPFISIPGKDWFKANRTAGKHRKGGHVPMRRSTLTRDQFQLVIDACWSLPGLKDRVWWETMFAWLWFSGMRITQARTQLQWSHCGSDEGIHLESQTIVTTDAKCGGQIVFPLPNSLMPGLLTLFHRKKRPEERDFVFRQWGLLSAEPFYAIWDQIWEQAFPCSSDAERTMRHFNPHQIRAVSVTNWDLRPSPDNSAGYLITGHRPADVRQAAYFKPGDERLKQIVERFDRDEMPRLRCPRPLF
jgi:integrase